MRKIFLQITILLSLFTASTYTCFVFGENQSAILGGLELEVNGFWGKTSLGSNTSMEKGRWEVIAIDTQKEEKSKQRGIDFQLFGTSIHCSKEVKRRFYIGLEAGILPDRFSWTVVAGENFSQKAALWQNEEDLPRTYYSYGQLLFFHLFGRLDIIHGKLAVDVGIRRARFGYSLNEEDRFVYPLFHGGYIKPTLSYNKLGAGFRLDIGVMSQRYGSINEFVVLFSPLIRFEF